ncbi:hypothetical protein CGZ96_09965 [Enemella evansiae]|uniref:LamG-like jellyroll fold domain-containing protein n=1 Tax=Enemella evansiae TaxID=2016499 RepID=UPI000B964000|nr:LamG-like jellyroll fold domain-containing protein [Enemella evansiae]OYN98031.1 hypothetical protein CGZ96_09965 [Enemella evansiae]
MNTTTWPGLILLVAARTVLFAVLGMAVWAVTPLALGWTSTTVVTGSMAPAINAGDVVVSMPMAGADVEPGRVVLANDPDHADRLRLHRMLERNPEGALILQGDANPEPDSSPIGNEEVRGIGVIRVPWLGLPLVWLRAGTMGPLVATTAALAVLCAIGSGQLQQVRRPAAIALTGTLAALGVLAVATLPPTASAAFSARSQSTAAFTTAATVDYGNLIRAAKPIVFWEGDTADPARDTSGASASTNNAGLTTQAGAGRTGRGGAVYLARPTGGMDLAKRFPGPGPQSFTLELWFKTGLQGQGGRLIGYGESRAPRSSGLYDRAIYLTTDGRIIYGNDGYGPNRLETKSRYDDGQWHHIVATRDASGMRLIVDGTALSRQAASVQSYDGHWRVGYDNLSGWPSAPSLNSFPGWADDIAIYDRALTVTEAQEHYRAGRPN